MLDGNLTQPNENNEIKILDCHKKCSVFVYIDYWLDILKLTFVKKSIFQTFLKDDCSTYFLFF